MLPYMETSAKRRDGPTAFPGASKATALPPISRWHAEPVRGHVRRGEMRCTPLYEPTKAVSAAVHGGSIGWSKRRPVGTY